jgi:hypothetical protein
MKEQSTGLLERVCPFSMSSTGSSVSSDSSTLIPLMDGYGVKITNAIHELPWAPLQDLTGNDAVLSSDLMAYLEKNPPTGFEFFYLTFFKGAELIGFAPFQLFEFRGDRNVQPEGPGQEQGWWQTQRARLLDWVIQRVHIRVMVNGNMLFTGDHSYRFVSEMETKTILALLEQGMEQLVLQLKAEGKAPHIYGIKDIPNDRIAVADTVLGTRLSRSAFSPDMVLTLPSEWKDFDDYLAAMTSKYRVRVKRARKKKNGLVLLELNERQIEEYQAELFRLFQNVVGTSSFNILHLEDDFFLGMKQTFPERYRLFGYFNGDQLIGFFTTLRDGDVLEAHYLGYDEAINRDTQLYLNMLYDMVEIGLEERVSAVNYARTSLEIKSSVGAKATTMWCYYKHRNKWINGFLPFLIKRYSQEDAWTPRHPFKNSQ